MRRILLIAPAAVIVAAFVTFGPAASAATTCSGGVFTGVNISGGLVVTGNCTYNDSTISGGVTITSSGHLTTHSSGISGGVVVQPSGEFDGLSGTSVSGGLKLTAAFDLDIIGATITGGTTISGPFSPGPFGPGVPFVCGSTLDSVTMSGVTGTFTFVPFGDPESGCAGNRLTGSLTVTNTHNIEIESNVIGGSVTISDSTAVELAGNTIKGSAQCTNITTFTDGDATPNTVQGSTNCP